MIYPPYSKTMPSDAGLNTSNRTRLVSVVIPCFNEQENIVEAIREVHDALRDAGEAHEIIVVDDGSMDESALRVREAATRFPEVRPVELMRNFGQSIAYQTGLDHAKGDYILFFSGDLEIPASELPRVIEALDGGLDFVNTSRRDRWGGSHALKSRLANAILNRITGTRFADRGSGLKGMRREVAKSIRLYGEWHRFIPDLASIMTERMGEFEVPFSERKAGVSSYRGRLKSVTVFLDLVAVAFTVLSNRKPYILLPGRLFGFSGLVIAFFGFAVSGWLAILKLFFGETLSDRPLFLVSILTLILGLIMVMIGALGEMMVQVAQRIDGYNGVRVRTTPNDSSRDT